MITIKPYLKEYYQEVTNILKEANHFDKNWDSKNNLSSMVEKDKESVIVALEENTIIGVLYITLIGNKLACLYRLVVKKEYRKQGIATSLIKYAESLLKNKGIVEVGMYVNSIDKELQTFYNERDFNASSNTSYIYMWKELIK